MLKVAGCWQGCGVEFLILSPSFGKEKSFPKIAHLHGEIRIC